MATPKSKGELVIPITVVLSLLLLSQLFVPKTVHVAEAKATVNLMIRASQDLPVKQIAVLLLKPATNVLVFYQTLIVVRIFNLQFCLLLNFCLNMYS